MKIRKAILTGGGRATRLHPITATINKHLIPLANKPMIFHAIEKAVEVGIEEIFININPGETELQKYIGDGGHWGIKIKFFEQTGGPQGIAHVVKCAKDFIGDEPFMFYLSDNIFFGSLKSIFDRFHLEKPDCLLAFAEVPDPERFGVPIFEDGKLIDIIEKPNNPPNNFAQTGIYLYGPKVFFQTFDKIEKSARGEYEISDIHSHFLKNGYKVGYSEVTGWWKDTGQPNDLLIANQLLLEKMQIEDFLNFGAIKEDVEIKGNVAVGRGTVIGPKAKIIGPVIIGENCELKNCEIGPNVTIGQGSSIIGAKIEDSLVFDNCTIQADLHLYESIFGKGIKLVKNQNPHPKKKVIVGDKTILEI